ncbi:MAG: glycosyltransferase, partial [Anaerolineales bacterium]|nr:glycosyltransferase [Anaerolineales bacterium]
PSKVFELMSSGLPIILGVKGEVEEIVRQANAGLCIEPENEECLTDAVIQMYKDPALRKQFAQDGPVYVNKNHNMQLLAERYLNVLEEVAKRK